MRLVYKATQEEVRVGDRVADHHGEIFTVTSIERPHHPGSTGRIYVTNGSWSHGYFPSVFEAKWIEREDRGAG